LESDKNIMRCTTSRWKNPKMFLCACENWCNYVAMVAQNKITNLVNLQINH